MVKRVRKYGEGRMTICAETGNNHDPEFFCAYGELKEAVE